MAKRIVLYSMKNCVHCQTVKQYLEKKGIQFRLCDVKTASGQKEFYKTGMRSVPVLKIGDQWLHGFTVSQFEQMYQY